MLLSQYVYHFLELTLLQSILLIARSSDASLWLSRNSREASDRIYRPEYVCLGLRPVGSHLTSLRRALCALVLLTRRLEVTVIMGNVSSA